MFSAQLHRCAGRLYWNLQHGKHDIALRNQWFRALHKSSIDPFVSTHIQQDPVLPLRIYDNKPDSGWMLVRHHQMARVDSLSGIEVGGNPAERVLPDQTNKPSFRAQSSGGNRLIG